MTESKAIILLSGGLDSATAAAIARQQGFTLYALSVDYGQRHRFELQAARRVAQSLGIARHVVLSVDLAQLGGSALTDAIDVPKDRPADEMAHGIPITYVPARNTVFLSLALAYAEVVGAADIFIGVNAIDYSGYPDCRPEYIAAFTAMANLATKASVEGRLKFTIHAPLVALDQGPDHPSRRGVGRRLQPDALLLRPRPGRRQLRPLRRLPVAAKRVRRSGNRGSSGLGMMSLGRNGPARHR